MFLTKEQALNLLAQRNEIWYEMPEQENNDFKPVLKPGKTIRWRKVLKKTDANKSFWHKKRRIKNETTRFKERRDRMGW